MHSNPTDSIKERSIPPGIQNITTFFNTQQLSKSQILKVQRKIDLINFR